MEAGEWKPLLSALVLPPAGPLLLAALGLALLPRRRRGGLALAAAGLALLWLLACEGFADRLAAALLPPVAPVTLAALGGVQAIVVLGGGVQAGPLEYGTPQLSDASLQRLRYGIRLARRAGKPLAFSGGVGWASAGGGMPTEAEAAAETARLDFGFSPRWLEARSRDTRENARHAAALLATDGIRRIALVTHAWHMPRAVREFEAAGLAVVPAPMGFPAPRQRALLDWLPSASGLTASRQLLREWLALRLSAPVPAPRSAAASAPAPARTSTPPAPGRAGSQP